MSDQKFSRRRRGMRFRPKGGLGQAQQKSNREAIQARADAVSEQGGVERVFEKRHAQEIERAENLAAGLPARRAPEIETPDSKANKKDFREPHLDTPAQVDEEKPFEPVALSGQPKGILDTIRVAATSLVKKFSG